MTDREYLRSMLALSPYEPDYGSMHKAARDATERRKRLSEQARLALVVRNLRDKLRMI